MRPVKLKLSAFGAYANEQIIDFRELKNQNIFIISGPTGAGKTTIFDAISYALYGDASGESREQESLRSHFATDEQATYVEFEFEIRGESYTVRRAPEQQKKKVRGEGTTTVKPEAELILPDGKMVTKVKNVTEKVTEILGINKDQFKQIVMLPQGEFKKLLLASSEEREKIFRKIFNTYSFERIQRQLKEKALTLSKDQERSRQQIKGMLQNIKIEPALEIEEAIDYKTVFELIQEDIIKQKEHYKVKIKKLEQLEKSQEQQTKKILEAKQTNALLEEKTEVLRKYQDLEGQKQAYNEKQSLLNRIDKIEPIIFAEKTLSDKQQELQVVVEKYKQSLKEIEAYETALKEATKSYEEEKQNEIKREAWRLEISRLESIAPKIEQYTSLEKAYHKCRKNYETLTSKSSQIEQEIKVLKKELAVQEEKVKNMQQLETKYVELDKELENQVRYYKHIGQIYKQVESYEKLREQHRSEADKYKEIESRYKRYKANYEQKDEIYKKEQAGILAQSLEEGKPCPVCGSTHHPSLATKKVGNVPTKEELKRLKEQVEESHTIYEQALDRLTKCRMEAQNKLEVINNLLEQETEILQLPLSYEEGLKAKVLEKGRAIGQRKNELQQSLEQTKEQIKQRITIEQDVAKKSKTIDERLIQIETLNQQQKECYGELQSLGSQREVLKKEIPEEIGNIEQLNHKVSRIKQVLETSKEQLETKEKVREQKAKQLEAEIARNKEFKMQEKGLQEGVRNLQEDFKKSIAENGFEDREEYNTIKEVMQSKGQLRSWVEEYTKSYSVIVSKRDDLVVKTKGLKEIAIDGLKDKMIEIEEQKRLQSDECKKIYSIIENNKDSLKAARAIYHTIEEKEEAYRVIGELSEVSNGNKKPYISFERYVLASYFDEIIGAANIRLKRMTSSRFQLKRRTSMSKGKNQKGLELQVYDNYTTSTRSIGSLSGGESFKASLALALGLSDVVQSSAGGVCLQTMFVDEGFGTLDPQSLDYAIDCLLQLQEGGRLVGIISHVEELKARIGAKLEVEVTNNGSKAKFNVM